MFFRKQNLLATTINIRPCRQNLGLVEAKNFVPYIWAPGTEGASGATGYFGSIVILRGRFFVVGKGEREGEGGDERRLA
jgi:hypothetical protein